MEKKPLVPTPLCSNKSFLWWMKVVLTETAVCYLATLTELVILVERKALMDFTILEHVTILLSWAALQWQENNISRTCFCSPRSFLPSAIQLLLSAPNQCYQKCRPLSGWTNFSKCPPTNRYCCLSVLVFCLSRTEQRGADTVLQPDLYSGQAVYYIKKVLGPLEIYLPHFSSQTSGSLPLQASFRYGQMLGEVKKSVHKRWRLYSASTQLFKGCFRCICPSINSTDNAVHFLILHLFDIIMCNTRWNIFLQNSTCTYKASLWIRGKVCEEEILLLNLYPLIRPWSCCPLHIAEWLSKHVTDLTSSPDSFFFFISKLPSDLVWTATTIIFMIIISYYHFQSYLSAWLYTNYWSNLQFMNN